MILYQDKPLSNDVSEEIIIECSERKRPQKYEYIYGKNCYSWWGLWIFLSIGGLVLFPIQLFIRSEVIKRGQIPITSNTELIIFYIIYVLFACVVCYEKRNG